MICFVSIFQCVTAAADDDALVLLTIIHVCDAAIAGPYMMMMNIITIIIINIWYLFVVCHDAG